MQDFLQELQEIKYKSQEDLKLTVQGCLEHHFGEDYQNSEESILYSALCDSKLRDDVIIAMIECGVNVHIAGKNPLMQAISRNNLNDEHERVERVHNDWQVSYNLAQNEGYTSRKTLQSRAKIIDMLIATSTEEERNAALISALQYADDITFSKLLESGAVMNDPHNQVQQHDPKKRPLLLSSIILTSRSAQDADVNIIEQLAMRNYDIDSIYHGFKGHLGGGNGGSNLEFPFTCTILMRAAGLNYNRLIDGLLWRCGANPHTRCATRHGIISPASLVLRNYRQYTSSPTPAGYLVFQDYFEKEKIIKGVVYDSLLNYLELGVQENQAIIAKQYDSTGKFTSNELDSYINDAKAATTLHIVNHIMQAIINLLSFAGICAHSENYVFNIKVADKAKEALINAERRHIFSSYRENYKRQ